MVHVKDPVVHTALQCLPDGAIPSKRQLMQDFGKVRRHVESFSLLPSSGGGLLAQMTATLGARLKIHVRVRKQWPLRQRCGISRCQRLTMMDMM